MTASSRPANDDARPGSRHQRRARPRTCRRASRTCATTWRSPFPPRARSRSAGRALIRFALASAGDRWSSTIRRIGPASCEPSRRTARRRPSARSTATSSCRPTRSTPARTPRARLQRRRRAAQPQRRFPLHDLRAGARAPGVSLLRSAGPEGAVDAGARRARRAGRRSATAPSSRAGRRRPDARDASPTTQPISTYLFAFAAGKFSVEQAERNGRTFRMFHRETDAAKVARNRDAIFDLHAAALDWLEQYTGDPLSVRQVRLPAGARVPVRRHGASGRDLLQRPG